MANDVVGRAQNAPRELLQAATTVPREALNAVGGVAKEALGRAADAPRQIADNLVDAPAHVADNVKQVAHHVAHGHARIANELKDVATNTGETALRGVGELAQNVDPRNAIASIGATVQGAAQSLDPRNMLESARENVDPRKLGAGGARSARSALARHGAVNAAAAAGVGASVARNLDPRAIAEHTLGSVDPRAQVRGNVDPASVLAGAPTAGATVGPQATAPATATTPTTPATPTTATGPNANAPVAPNTPAAAQNPATPATPAGAQPTAAAKPGAAIDTKHTAAKPADAKHADAKHAEAHHAPAAHNAGAAGAAHGGAPAAHPTPAQQRAARRRQHPRSAALEHRDADAGQSHRCRRADAASRAEPDATSAQPDAGERARELRIARPAVEGSRRTPTSNRTAIRRSIRSRCPRSRRRSPIAKRS